jgi:membrane-associated phospholipid phosphatase
LMLLSRISGGLHWPLDILVGSIVGILSAFSIYKWRNLNILKKTNTFLIQIASFLKL